MGISPLKIIDVLIDLFKAMRQEMENEKRVRVSMVIYSLEVARYEMLKLMKQFH